MIDAIYDINEYLKPLLTTAGYTMSFYPGTFAPENPGDKFILYSVRPGTGYDFYMVHTDIVRYQIYHNSFDSLHRVVEAMMTNLNVDRIQDQITSDASVRFLDAHLATSGDGEAIYLEGNNYYFVNMTLTVEYTLP